MKRTQEMLDVHDLELKTKSYWLLSQSAHGIGLKDLTAGAALNQGNKLLSNLNPARKLWKLTAQLQGEIIAHGGCKKAKKKPATNILKFKAVQTN